MIVEALANLQKNERTASNTIRRVYEKWFFKGTLMYEFWICGRKIAAGYGRDLLAKWPWLPFAFDLRWPSIFWVFQKYILCPAFQKMRPKYYDIFPWDLSVILFHSLFLVWMEKMSVIFWIFRVVFKLDKNPTKNCSYNNAFVPIFFPSVWVKSGNLWRFSRARVPLTLTRFGLRAQTSSLEPKKEGFHLVTL